ncbi:hypothetical protein LPJ63_003005 [Coemansia sp. RSA 2711]|nr:hypothetical protein LPJ63_003005 [Coemansia sp. RSA 2711]
MEDTFNTRVVLQAYPPKDVHTTSCFTIDRSQPVPDASALQLGQVLVKTEALSIDPHHRLYIDAPGESGPGEEFRYPLGQPIFGIGVGTVVASRSDSYSIGDWVRGDELPWQAYTVISDQALTKLPKTTSAPLLDHIGVLGMPAFTAYLGIVTVGRPKRGETLLVSAASGAVGQIAVQLGKVNGLRVVGVAGSDDKVEHIKHLGADAVINYKACEDYARAINQAAPEGIDIYFDNVGGEFLDAALLNLNRHARVVICGSISTYAADKSKIAGVKNLDTTIVKEVTLQSIYYQPHLGTLVEADFLEEMAQMVACGQIEFKTDERIGLESAPQALVDLFTGRNFGKLIVRL